MYRFIIPIILLWSSALSGQDYGQKNLMIHLSYQPDVQISQKVVIEQALQDIQQKAGRNFFKSIYWSNDIIEADEILAEITRTLNNLDDTGLQVVKMPEAIVQIFDRQKEQLVSHDYFLNIIIEGSPGERQSFRFDLFSVHPGSISQNDDIQRITPPAIKFYDKIASTNCIYNFDTDSDKVIANTVKQLFKDIINAPSDINIDVDGIPYLRQEIVRGLGDTVHISVFQSDDIDTPRSDFTFSWQQIDEKGRFNPSAEMVLNLKQNAVEQFICPTATGKYKVGIKIFDGIEYSVEDTVTIEIIDIPQLVFALSSSEVYEKISVFQWLLNPKKHNRKVNKDVKMALDNYPEKDWSLELLDVRYERGGLPSRPPRKPLLYDIYPNPDRSQTIALNGKLRRNCKVKYFLRGTYRGINSNIQSLTIKKPYVFYIEDMSVGFGSFIKFRGLGDPNQILRVAPLEFSIHIPLWYEPESSDYVSLAMSTMTFYGDGSNEFTADAVELSLKINNGTRNKKVKNKFIKEFNHYYELNYLTPSTLAFPDAKIGINPSSISIDSKLIGFELEPLNIYFDINCFANAFFHSSLKINIGSLYQAGFYPDYILHY